MFIERFYMIVIRSKINGRAFIERVIQLVRAEKIEDAIKLCQQSNAVLPDMGLLILRSRSRDEADLQNVADAAALSVLPRLTRRLHYLPMLANVATLIGLLGTIFGLRHAFQSVSAAGGGAALGGPRVGHRGRAERNGLRLAHGHSADGGACIPGEPGGRHHRASGRIPSPAHQRVDRSPRRPPGTQVSGLAIAPHIER